MILTRIQIENYKQYQGSHDIEVPAQATIGVIGENGTGKTTLFEAIEWCLYSPRAISPGDVRPRGHTGHTTVTVHLESADGTRHFIVERVLKRTPSASIFQADSAGEIVPIVQGPRQVSDYVATKLIGLSHTAFTATFFTRQKELHLFGDESPGKRRQEVGRLLGLETIRTAQKSIIGERSKAAADARAMTAQYERESEGRDFTSELALALGRIDEHTGQLTHDAEAIGSSERARIDAESRAESAQTRRDEDVGYAQQLAQHRQERQSLEHRSSQLGAELSRLDAREQELVNLQPLAASLDTLRQEVTGQEEARLRFEQRTNLERQLEDCGQRQRDLNRTVHGVVIQVSLSSPIDDWIWSTDDTLNIASGIARLLEIVDRVDLPAAERRERNYRAARLAADELTSGTATLAHYTGARAELDKDERELLVNGEPRDKIPALEQERDWLNHDRTTFHANRTSLESDRDKARIILGNLEKQRFGDDCPTCGRPFTEEDAVQVATALRERTGSLTSSIDQSVRDSRRIDQSLGAIETQRKAIFEEIEQIENLRKRIHKSVSVLDGQQESVDKALARLAAALAEAELKEAPSPAEITRVESTARELRQLVGSRSTLRVSLDTCTSLDRQIKTATRERDDLGEITFDPEAFRRLTSNVQAADRAQTTITQIALDIARRPELETERESSAQRMAEIDGRVVKLTELRAALGFDPTEVSEAEVGLRTARENERATVERFHRTQTSLRESEMRRDAVVKEQERLERLAKAADAKRSDADHLDLIAREFTEFERYAAGRKRPILSEYTSHLVSNITDGKYDRVDFDQDFGIIVFDGEDAESSYPVNTFSGGERDAITLAARIALSRMIGHQAANPPGFLVLDEVFGSLDTDRRALLLDLLGSISSTFEELRQVFIISHVDDVRTSPALDELWRIEETAEGSSMVTSLSPGADIDAL